MGNVGRFFCVALPFALTVGSVIAMLVAALAGVTDKSPYMFQVNTTDLSISAEAISDLLSRRAGDGGFAAKSGYEWHDDRFLQHGTTGTGTSGDPAADVITTTADVETGSSAGSLVPNVTAAELGLGKLYDINVWGLCETLQSGERNCTKPQFGWASDVVNQTEQHFASLAAEVGKKVTLPKDLTDALKVFSKVSKWAEVVFVIALVAMALELLVGLFASCSRGISCLTFLVAAVATVATVAAAALATATATVVVGALDTTAKGYGVTSSLNGKFLAAVWISAALALAAGFFWLFTVCCCAPDHHARPRGPARRRHRDDDAAGEKLIPAGAYQPLAEPTGYNGAGQPQVPRFPTAAGPRSDLAYEPYAHARV